MLQIIVDGNTIAYQAHLVPGGQGSFLFIHGSGGDHHKWDAQMQKLPQGFSGVAIDLPGHSSSPGPLLKTVDEAARLVSNLPCLLSLPRPVFLVGHSMGAAIAITIALDYGHEIDGIILIGGGSRLRVLPAMLEALRVGHKNPDFLRAGFAPDTPEAIVDAELSAYQQVPAEVLLNDFSACDRFDRSKEVAGINIPTLLIVGENDQLTPVKYSRLLQDSIQESKLVVIPQAGHYVMLEKGATVSQSIEEFILGVSG